MRRFSVHVFFLNENDFSSLHKNVHLMHRVLSLVGKLEFPVNNFLHNECKSFVRDVLTCKRSSFEISAKCI